MDRPILILGAGIAGLWTALKLAPRKVVLVTGAPLGYGAATGWAQGGVAVAAGPGDSAARHAKDTLNAGAGLTDPEAANYLAQHIRAEIDALRTLGVPFETDVDQRLSLGLEAAHSHPRIAHILGDQAGAEILSVLVRAARKSQHIEILEHHWATALIENTSGGCAGARVTDRSGQACDIPANTTIIATGGYSGLFAQTTSPPGARGQALAMAYALGAEIKNPEFVQFHPTAIQTGGDPLPLATEALRGEGARLIDSNGLSITGGQDLAARDQVARHVHRALATGRGAFLDCRDAIGRHFPQTFPSVFAHCMNAGLDPRITPIPIAPAAHYTMGGITTDLDGQTSIPGLLAVGECANNGLHGANRLASNSLAEGLVFGHRLALGVLNSAPRRIQGRVVREAPTLPPIVIRGLRHAMSALAGVERNRSGLVDLISRIDRLETRYGCAHEVVMARLIGEAALARCESRGAHARSDFPQSLALARDTRLCADTLAAQVAAE